MFGKLGALFSSIVSGVVSSVLDRIQAWRAQRKLQQAESEAAALKAHHENEQTRKQVEATLANVVEEARLQAERDTGTKSADEMLAHLRKSVKESER